MALTTFTSGQVLTAAQLNAVQANDYNQTVSTKTANYTLVAADKGTRVVMNAAGATTITVNTSLFSAGDTLVIQNIGAGTTTVTAGTATVSSAGPLAIPTNGSGTLYFTSAGVSIFYPSAGPAASSGLTFIASGSLAGVSTLTFTNCFSATYDNYFFTMVNIVSSGSGKFRLRMGTGTAHRFNLQYADQSTYALDSAASSGNFWNLAANGNNLGGYIQVQGPFLTAETKMQSMNERGVEFSISQGAETSSTSFTNATFSSENVITFTSGTIKVYGYANS